MEFKPEGQLGLSDKIDLKEVIRTGEILEGTAVRVTRNNLIVDIDNKGLKGVININDFEDSKRETKKISLMHAVGKKVQFIVTDDSNGNIKLSRKLVQSKFKDYIKNNLHKGDIIKAVVIDATSTEVYLDIGCGYKAVLYREDISVVRIQDAKDYFNKGQEVYVVVKDITDRGVLVTHKELLGTFKDNIAIYDFNKKDTVIGRIERVSKNTIHISLGQNIAGLAEYSDMLRVKGLEIGDYVSVFIKTIVPKKIKVKLSIIGKAEKPNKTELKYFIQDGNIERWRYSPENSCNVIESVFEQ